MQALYMQDLAARVIQRRYRGHKARKVVMQLKFKLIVVYIQSYIRMFLAKAKKRRLLQAKYSVVVQKYLRRYLAKRCYFQMLSDAYDQMKLRKVHLIQFHARVYVRRVRRIRQVRNRCATQIQKVMKGYSARKELAVKRHFLSCVAKIQCFYRRRHLMRHRQACRVQKYLKGLRAFKKYRRLAAVR